METQAIFGPAGNGDTFSQHHRSSVEAPGWLRGLGLGLLEYQCGRAASTSGNKRPGRSVKRQGNTRSAYRYTPPTPSTCPAEKKSAAKRI